MSDRDKVIEVTADAIVDAVDNETGDSDSYTLGEYVYNALQAAGYVVARPVPSVPPIKAPAKYLHLSGRACEAWARGWNECREAMLAAQTDTAPDGEE